MFVFGRESQKRLATVHYELRDSCSLALSWQVYDFGISWGFRDEESQTQAFISGNSRTPWPASKHNVVGPDGHPMSDAIDFYPWTRLPNGNMGIPWNDTHAFAVVAGLILAAGAELGIRLRWGGDWDHDVLTTDHKLRDFGHIERAT